MSYVCTSCGKNVEQVGGTNHCGFCGTSLDEETQKRISMEYTAMSEQRALVGYAERLEEYAVSAGERDALARIRERIESMDYQEFMPDS